MTLESIDIELLEAVHSEGDAGLKKILKCIQKGANVNAVSLRPGWNRFTCIEIAACNGDVQTVFLLLENGASKGQAIIVATRYQTKGLAGSIECWQPSQEKLVTQRINAEIIKEEAMESRISALEQKTKAQENHLKRLEKLCDENAKNRQQWEESYRSLQEKNEQIAQTHEAAQERNRLLQEENDQLKSSIIHNSGFGSAIFILGVASYLESENSRMLKLFGTLMLMLGIYILVNRTDDSFKKFSASSSAFFSAIGDATVKHGFTLAKVTGVVSPNSVNVHGEANVTMAANMHPQAIQGSVEKGAVSVTSTVQPGAVKGRACVIQ